MEFEANEGHSPEPVDYTNLVIALENTIAAMAREIERLKGPEKDSYSYSDFVLRVCLKFGKSYGWKAAYVAACTDARCHVVSAYMIDDWRKTNKVPMWAVRQLDFMTLKQLPRKRLRHAQIWSEAEKQFLIELFLHDRQQTNDLLAVLCTKEFKRKITGSAIKGQLDRLAGAGRFNFETRMPIAATAH